jgi:hypothetical protein
VGYPSPGLLPRWYLYRGVSPQVHIYWYPYPDSARATYQWAILPTGRTGYGITTYTPPARSPGYSLLVTGPCHLSDTHILVLPWTPVQYYPPGPDAPVTTLIRDTGIS